MVISDYFILTYVFPNMALDTVALYRRKELRLHMNSQTSNREMESWSKESIWFSHTMKYRDAAELLGPEDLHLASLQLSHKGCSVVEKGITTKGR